MDSQTRTSVGDALPLLTQAEVAEMVDWDGKTPWATWAASAVRDRFRLLDLVRHVMPLLERTSRCGYNAHQPEAREAMRRWKGEA